MKRFLGSIFWALALLPVNGFAGPNIQLTPGEPVPEPISLILMITGLAGVLGARRFLRK